MRGKLQASNSHLIPLSLIVIPIRSAGRNLLVMLCRTRVGENAGVLRLRTIVRFANDSAALRMTKMVRVEMDPAGLKIFNLKSAIWKICNPNSAI